MFTKKGGKVLFFLGIMIVLVTITSVITWAVRSNPTEPLKTVVISSNDYDSAGSWQIEKSAEWTGVDTARITLDVSTIPYLDGRSKDIILVMDCSNSYFNGDLQIEKTEMKNLLDYIFENNNANDNKVALISYGSSSEILSNFSDEKNVLKSEIDSLNYLGNSSYSEALLNVELLLNNYEYDEDRDLNIVFFTYRYPNADAESRTALYEKIKDKYPYANFHGVQLYLDLFDPLVEITDKQWLATTDNLYEYLLQAALDSLKYEKFEISDYIDADYFVVNSEDDINVSIGNASLTEEDGLQKIVWNLNNQITSSDKFKMTIDVTLKSGLSEIAGLYTTNNHIDVSSKILGKSLTNEESDRTPVLKNYYQVSYDTNLPSGCTISDIEQESHAIYTNVTKNQDNLSCSGYIFQGWQIVENDVKRVNDEVFIMPEHDVTLKAIWSKPSISKSMEGTIHEQDALYKRVKSDYLTDNFGNLYSGAGSENYANDVYYYTGNRAYSEQNNVIFGGFCWKMVRTTETGGVKLLYNGKPDNGGSCDSSRSSTFGYSDYEIVSLASDYAYGTDYTYDEDTMMFSLSGTTNNATWDDTTYEGIVGKYTCLSDDSTDTCSVLYYVDEYNSSSSGKCFSLSSYVDYNELGSVHNLAINSPAYLGYMYNTVYPAEYMYMDYYVGTITYDTDISIDYYIGDNASKDEYGIWHLTSPYKLTSVEEYADLVGKYTFLDTENNNDSYTVYYIVGVDDEKIYYLFTSYETIPDVNKTLKFGDTITPNGDDTYTISGNIQTINYSDWVNNYQNVVNKYTCNDDSLTCSNPYMVTSTTKTEMSYYDYNRNFKYGNSFSYNDSTGMYTLVDTVQFYNFLDRYDDLGTHHYTCFNDTGVCETISYAFQYDDSYNNNLYYINLTDGKSVEDALDEMLFDNNVNTKSSPSKKAIDLWYEKNLIDYENYLEDTVYCNDRSIYHLGGWDPDGDYIYIKDTGNGYFGDLQFNRYESYQSNSDYSLTCPNSNDKFTVSNSNGNGNLTHPIGLLTYDEIGLIGYVVGNYSRFMSGTPAFYSLDTTYGFSSVDGFVGSGNTSNEILRPAISLKPNTEYLSGDGSEQFPYIITE